MFVLLYGAPLKPSIRSREEVEVRRRSPLFRSRFAVSEPHLSCIGARCIPQSPAIEGSRYSTACDLSVIMTQSMMGLTLNEGIVHDLGIDVDRQYGTGICLRKIYFLRSFGLISPNTGP